MQYANIEMRLEQYIHIPVRFFSPMRLLRSTALYPCNFETFFAKAGKSIGSESIGSPSFFRFSVH
jgi:hypothetical protein